MLYGPNSATRFTNNSASAEMPWQMAPASSSLVPAICGLPGVFIGLEQRHELLNQQSKIKGIGGAGAQNQARIIKRHSLLQGEVANL